MSVEAKLATLEKSVAQLRRKGVTAIKVELEAQLNRNARGDDDYDSEYCEHCDEGRYDCPECWWSSTRDAAVVSCPSCGNDDDSREDCERCEGYGNVICTNCDGDGRLDCEECDGTGYVQSGGQFSDSDDCLNFILAQVEGYTNTRRINNNGAYEEHNPFEWMKYAQFYYDGSVDSELTFTIENSVEAVRYLPSVVKAFSDLADEVGNGMDTRGAGMHMALLFSENGVYPDEAANYNQETLDRMRQENYWDHLPEVSTRIPDNQLRNFKRSLTQLLPALYFLGSPNEVSRGMSYRMPYVSIDEDDRGQGGSSKYCAITYRYGAIEYRIFETCYDNPEVILDNVVVMANSIRYLSEEYISPGVDKKTKIIRFGADGDNSVARFYRTSEHLDALNLGLQRLKPSYYTIKQLKQARKFSYTKHHANGERNRIVKVAEKAYEEYSERYDFLREIELKTYANNILVSKFKHADLETLRGADMTKEVEEAMAEAERSYRRKEDKDTYINNIVQNNLRNLVGDYALEFN